VPSNAVRTRLWLTSTTWPRPWQHSSLRFSADGLPGEPGPVCFEIAAKVILRPAPAGPEVIGILVGTRELTDVVVVHVECGEVREWVVGLGDVTRPGSLPRACGSRRARNALIAQYHSQRGTRSSTGICSRSADRRKRLQRLAVLRTTPDCHGRHVTATSQRSDRRGLALVPAFSSMSPRRARCCRRLPRPGRHCISCGSRWRRELAAAAGT
jgi:hypothetical protein